MSEDREHPASDKQRKEFRERGQVARSRELTMAGVLLVGGATVIGTLPRVSVTAVAFARAQLGGMARGHAGLSTTSIVWTLFSMIGVVGVVCALAALAASIAQAGVLPTKAWAKFDFEKLNPLPRLMQLFGSKQAFQSIALTFVKMAIIIGVSYGGLQAAAFKLANFAPASVADALSLAGEVLLTVAKRAIPAVLAIGAADYGFTRFKLEQEMKMTPEQVKEEYKEDNGDPHVKSHRRRRARELLKQRSVKAVATADVVVVNPTHYAVALSYKSSKMRAPKVVAKGLDESALRIKEIAKENNVPIVQDIPLARALHARVKVNREVPPDLYKAVALTLAFVYRQKQRVA